jgi:hypothetical protein
MALASRRGFTRCEAVAKWGVVMITSHAIQAIAFILLCDNGIDAVDACNALLDAQAANQLARAAEQESDALNATSEAMAARMRKPGDGDGDGVAFALRFAAVELLKSGWLPDGWES